MASNLLSDTEKQLLLDWLGALPAKLELNTNSLTPIDGDASFRRYFRINSAKGELIVMHAPTLQENTQSFVNICQILATNGIIVPEILASDLNQGFLLLSNLGENFLSSIKSGEFKENDFALQQHYRGALRALVQMQLCPTSSLPVYDQPKLIDELGLFTDWYLKEHLNYSPDADTVNMLDHTFKLLAKSAASQPQVFVHRDFHSPNLMIGSGAPDYIPGIIDFQDAVLGPISYDIASLVMDARTSWDESQQIDWAVRYWEYAREAKLPVPDDFAQFHTDYEWIGLQRNLRILGVFIRLSKRDNKHHYMDHLPRVSIYIRQVASRYAVFHPLLRLLDKLEQVPTQDGFSF